MRTFLSKLMFVVMLQAVWGVAATECLAARKAVVVVPVVDLLAYSLGEGCKTAAEVKDKYSKVRPSWDKSKDECCRVHQLLFNEVVDVVGEEGFELKVALKNAYYEPSNDCHYLWALKEHFVYLDEVDLEGIPAPINYSKGEQLHTDAVVTLKMPLFDVVTNRYYSVGTRFCCLGIKQGHAKVVLRNGKTSNLVRIYIPLQYCFVDSAKMSHTDRINSFVSVLHSWVLDKKHSTDAVPYVWGGISFCFKQKIANCKNINRKKDRKEDCYTGFDASGYILRVAQICGLPYFFKNSTTAAANLRPLRADEKPGNGDIIAVKDFIAVINDAYHNKIVRAAGIGSGYGCVVENNLNEVFLGIKTYQELKARTEAGEPITCIGKKGEVRAVLNGLKIYAIRSLWEQ